MFRSAFTKVALAAVAAFTVGIADARADLTIQISVVGQGTSSFTVLGNPQTGLGSVSHTASFGGFTVTASSLTSLQSGGGIQHTHAINFAYNGPLGGTSQTLIITMIGTNYNAPLGPLTSSSNGSPSQSGGAMGSVLMQSGVSLTNAGLPASPGDVTGLAPTSFTSGSGTIGLSSSVLMPNPSSNGPFTTGPGLYSYMQVFTFSNFTATGLGSFSAAANIVPVPEPATIVGAGIALASIGAFRFRKRRQVKA